MPSQAPTAISSHVVIFNAMQDLNSAAGRKRKATSPLKSIQESKRLAPDPARAPTPPQVCSQQNCQIVSQTRVGLGPLTPVWVPARSNLG
jgi:hypothetical protein